MLSTRDPLQSEGHAKIESRGMEKRHFMQTEMTRKWREQYSDKNPFQNHIKNKT